MRAGPTLPLRCLRCGGEIPEGHGYYHTALDRCIEVLRRRLDHIEAFLRSDVNTGFRPFPGGAVDSPLQDQDRR